MPRYRLGDVDIWFGTADAPAPAGIEHTAAPGVTVGISASAVDPVVHLRYRRQGGPWQRLRLLHSHSGNEAAYYTATFPALPPSTLIEYEVYLRCAGARPRPELRAGERASFQVLPRPAETPAELPAPPPLEGPAPVGAPMPVIRPQISGPAVPGTVVAPALWSDTTAIAIDAYADDQLQRHVGSAVMDGDGRFRLVLDGAPEAVWFSWRHGTDQGRTPLLQPWRPGAPLRVHAYRSGPDQRAGSTSIDGFVRLADGRPVPGVRTWLVEVTLRTTQVLTWSVTDDTGSCTLTYDTAALLAARSPDLRIVVFDEHETPLVESRAPIVVLPATSVGAPSLYDRVRRSVYDLLGGPGAAPAGELTADDIAYLAERTAVPVETLVRYAETPRLAERLGIDEASAFALAATRGPTMPAEALRQAVERGDVSRSVLSHAAETQRTALHALRGETAARDFGRGSLADLLALRVDDADARHTLGADLLDPAGHPDADPALRFLLDVTDTAGLDVDLARALHRLFDGREIRSSADLAGWTTEQWETWLRDADVPGTAGPGLRGYARQLHRRFEQRFPDRVFRALVESSTPAKAWARRTRDFLDRHRDFDISAPLRDFQAQHPHALPAAAGADVAATLRAVQRLTPVAGSLIPAALLLDAGLRSASSIVSLGRTEFVRRFTPAFDGDDADAAAAYGRARRRAALASYTHAALSNDFHRAWFVAPERTGLTDRQRRQAVDELGLGSQTDLELTWDRLFGASQRSFCSCSDCRSVFGPAAYLFDLLVFLRRFTADPDAGGESLLTHFAARRPDVPLVRLSCANTTIEVPHIDLVNELLGDLVAAAEPPPDDTPVDECGCRDDEEPQEPPIPDDQGTPSSDACAAPERESAGTSAERRALPQNEPGATVLARLSGATYPWPLPYDYARDRARSARDQLDPPGQDLALDIWRFATSAPDAPDDAAIRALAAHTLDLGPAEYRLLVRPPHRIAGSWGPEVAAAAVAGTGPSVAALERAGVPDYATLEAALDTRYVRAPDAASPASIALLPLDSCDLETLRLVVDRPHFCAVLQRLSQFERLRRHLGWTAEQLDEALRWAGPRLEPKTLDALGLLRFLQLRLGLGPDVLLALFRDPEPTPPVTLRARGARSPFEALFGSATFDPPDPGTYGVGGGELADLLSAQIDQRVAAGLDAIRVAFARGFVAELSGPAAIMAAPDPAAAFRSSVSAVFRVARLADALRLSTDELVDLIDLQGLRPLPRQGDSMSPQERLRDAVALVDLAERAGRWPLEIAEARYIVTADPAPPLSPSATQAGLELLKLHRDLTAADATAQPGPSDVRTALRADLAELLSNVRLVTATGRPPESAVDRLTRLLTWSVVLPHLEAEARGLLPAAVTDGWEPQLYTAAEHAGAASAWTAALDSLADPLAVWLQQELRAAAPTPGAGEVPASPTMTFIAVVQALRGIAAVTISGPGTDDLTVLADALRAFAAPSGVVLSDPDARAWAARCRDDAVAHLAQRLDDWQLLAARRVRPRLLAARRRLRSEQLVVQWVMRTFLVEEGTATMLLHRLGDPADPARSLLRAMVAEDGSTPRLAESFTTARYADVPAVGPVPAPGAEAVEAVRERLEPSLSFDWSAVPPPTAIDPANFNVVLSAAVPIARLRTAGQPVRLLVETDGRVQVSLRAGTVTRVVLDGDAAGRIGRLDADRAELSNFLTELGSAPPGVVTLRISYTGRSDTGAAAGQPGAHCLRVFVSSGSGSFDDLRPGTLTAGLLRLDKAARLVRGVRLPTSAWTAFAAPADATRRIDLNTLPLETGTWAVPWRRLLALEELWKRQDGVEAPARWLALVTGGQVPVTSLPSLLNLAPQEVDGVLKLLGATPADDNVAVVAGTDCVYLVDALHLADRARRIGLPVRAVARWTTATADEIYQWSLAALRSRYPEDEWLAAAARIHDPVRERLRDAQVTWLTTRAGTAAFPSAEAISSHLFTDVQMTACMPTSRIQFAYAAVQRFVDAARLGYDIGPARGDQQDSFDREWDWRRLYRLWEANRRVWVNPENWIEPDVRPDKTALFRRLEEDLLAGPLTSESAEQALAGYVAGLVEVARPEILAIVDQQELIDFDSPLGFRDPDLRGTHVFARSRTLPQKLFYRRRLPHPDGRWTAWEQLDIELEGSHYLAVVAFGRLRLICAQMAAASTAEQDRCEPGTTDADSPTYEVSLAWIDRRHGRWSAVSRSDRFRFTVPLDDPPSGEQLWTKFPASQFPTVDIDPTDRIKRIGVQVFWGPDGIEQDSRLTAAIVDTSGGADAEIGFLKPTDGYYRTNGWWLFANDIPSRIDAEQITRVKLIWEPRLFAGSNDDVHLTRFMVYFRDGAGHLLHSSSVTAGTGREANGNANSLTIPFTMVWNRTFEGTLDKPIDLGAVSPTVSNFDIDYDLLPRTVDLSHAVRIEARSTDADSLTIELHSTNHTRTGRIRPRFRLKPDVVTWMPEVKDRWPSGWVTGDELCFPYHTVPQPVSTLRLFADGTVTQESASTADPGQHPGTVPEGQLMVSTAPDGHHRVHGDDRILARTPGPYQLSVPRDVSVSGGSTPKIVDESSAAAIGRTLFVERAGNGTPTGRPAAAGDLPPTLNSLRLALTGKPLPMVTSSRPGPGGTGWVPDLIEPADDPAGWSFRSFWHPHATGFLRVLESRGTPRLLRFENQELTTGSDLDTAEVDFFASYQPTQSVSLPWPRADVDFSVDGAYADYNWELFFHAPLLIAQRLSEAGRFEEAERWFRFLFDPTKLRPGAAPWEAFQTKPLREATVQRVQDMLDLLLHGTVSPEFEAQIERLNRYPYQPHLIARGRVSAYAMALVMRYLDHLIREGDALFRSAYNGDNRTNLEIASTRYDLAVRLLGERREALPERTNAGAASCFASLADESETPAELWDPVIEVESSLGGQDLPDDPLPHDGAGVPRLYFCVPHNDRLAGYWSVLADRLVKLRSCRDIEGVSRALSLYGRRIDPGLLVQATAEGLDLDVLLGRLSAPAPAFRFRSLAARANAACDRARQFGDALLSAIEKRDAEELGRLRGKHEIALLEAGTDLRAEQLQEAEASRDALLRNKENAERRQAYYATRARVSPGEKAEGRALTAAGVSDTKGAAAARAAADWAWVPSVELFAEGGAGYPGGAFVRAGGVSRYTVGGQTLVQVHRNNAEAQAADAAAGRVEAAQLGRQAGFDRRGEEWQHQEALASGDIQQLDRQVTAAQIRVLICELERDNQGVQLDNAKATDAFIRDKFSNAQLYRWTESRLTQLHYQQYRMAHELASLAQAALVRELGLADQPPVPDTWNPTHRGIGAAADLAVELERWERQYVQAWRREHEKTKQYSLAERQPLALLELVQRGECTFQIREHELDEDEPGDYFRRLRTVALDVACIRGSHTPVNARLTLLRSSIRLAPHTASDAAAYPREEGPAGAGDERFRDDPGGSEHIVTSSGIADDGLFDNGDGGEALRPFEGSGAISVWRLELDPATNHFDRDTVSNVVVRLQYTSRAGGELAAAAAREARAVRLAARPEVVMLPLDLLDSSEWHRFVAAGADGHDLRIRIEDRHVPYRLLPVNRIVGTDLYFALPADEDLRIEGAATVGAVTEPAELGPRADDRRPPLPIRRLSLREPLRFGVDRRIRLGAGSGVPRRGWLACWVKAP
ncbi:neuraminidase-like domain-containing protein [Actinoplanes auranticolor]|uniref:Virulence plasmid A protein n=1 Tax=Actinoplanes auranticolor TaxID=47988 RepID=A0A919SP40_9ACTN|nr:neuraminidase-like domain-containing protein [Actinoplanes auranticolor]GIM76395.1 hypothetical protein Aau02nite_70650 [Actinoplanes auranticolor]